MATIQIPPGQLNIKGPQQPNVVNVWSPLAGALAWAGLVLTVAISTHTTVALGAGSLVYQGLALTVRTGDVMIDIPAGSLVFKGPQRPQEIPQPLAGSLAWTGQAPLVLINVPGSSIAVPPGAIVWQGYAPLRVPNIFIDVPAGALAFTGQYVAVAFKGLDAGSLVWQGLAPTVSITGLNTIAIPAGSLAYTGLQNRIDWSTGIPAGSLVWQGRTPESGETRSIAVPAGSLVFTGQAPLSIRDIPIVLGVGALRWSSDLAPVVHLDEVRALGAGVLAFTGQLLTVGIGVADTTVAIPAGSEVFTGHAPTSIATTTTDIAIPAGSIVYTGETPVLLNGQAPAVDAGALVFTGYVTGVQVLSPFTFPAGSLVWTGLRMKVLNSGVTSDVGLFEYYNLYLY